MQTRERETFDMFAHIQEKIVIFYCLVNEMYDIFLYNAHECCYVVDARCGLKRYFNA